MRLALDRCKALRFYRKICSKGSQKVERIAKLLGIWKYANFTVKA